MRQMISGLVAAVAVMVAGAAPAMACGGGLFQGSCSPCGQYASPCAQQEVYAAPVATYGYGGCGSCGGWATERLPNPVHQYYYVNQGPTYTGPGNLAPAPVYEEEGYEDAAVEAPAYYGYRAHPRYHAWHESRGYGYGYGARHYGYGARHYGYGASHYGFGYHHGYMPHGDYAPHHNMRYGYAPHRYGYHHEYPLRRYN
jgi:hypothetical protein